MQAKKARLVLLVAAVPAVLLLCGCAHKDWSGRPEPFVGNQGGAPEAVFSGPEVVAALAYEMGPGPESFRRDASLNPRSPEPIYANDDWPRRPQPTLERSRRLFLRSDARQIIFFGRPHGFHSDHRY